eukprot:15021571-Alexandrium_andersonii.AAC.1
MQNCFTHSELELRGPGSRLKSGHRSSEGVNSVPRFHADSESTDDSKDRGGPKSRNRAVLGYWRAKAQQE